jgi:hypothetical protein
VTITHHVVTIPSSRAMEIIPSFALANGVLVRPHPFSTADRVFAEGALAAAKQFIAATRARVFHLIDVDGASAAALAIARQILEAGAERVILEGNLRDTALAADRVQLVVDEASDVSESDALCALHGDDDIIERCIAVIDRGLGILHHGIDPQVGCDVAARIAAGGGWDFIHREPAATTSDIERVVGHHKTLYRGGVQRVIVDGEWYVDYNTMNEPFDLLR